MEDVHIVRKRRVAMSRQHIPKEALKKRAGAGGRSLTYAETWQVIENMNTVFEHTWSHSIVRLERQINERTTTIEDKNGATKTVVEKNGSGWICVVRVSVDGHGSHEGVGFGTGTDDEKATKEAESDAIKRACKNWGNYFGLSLYDKDHLAELKM
jgi:DNA repair and recombination protein RAD52